MPDQRYFCNVPWYEVHIYWDGSLGICCSENHKLYNQENYNIANTGLIDWFNSQPVRDFRLAVLGSQPVSACQACMVAEGLGGHSRRLKSNQKSAIFTQQAFVPSLLQSTGQQHFVYSAQNNGKTKTLPVELHIDLGNHCNLACKMCHAQSSSRIASQEVKWGNDQSRKFLGVDWTADEQVWQRFTQELLALPALKNIHFMGGETLLSPRMEQLIDAFVNAGRFDMCFSFVTNGTVFNHSLMNKLSHFARVGIEVSIETVTAHNAYQRQGTDTELVLNYIDQYLSYCNQRSITVALRPVPSALTVAQYWTLLRYAMQKQLIVKSIVCTRPAFLDAKILPWSVRQQYLEPYHSLLTDLKTVTVPPDYNASDPNNCLAVIRQEAEMMVQLLTASEPVHSKQLQSQLVKHCQKWDAVFGLHAPSLYPELADMWSQHGY